MFSLFFFEHVFSHIVEDQEVKVRKRNGVRVRVRLAHLVEPDRKNSRPNCLNWKRHLQNDRENTSRKRNMCITCEWLFSQAVGVPWCFEKSIHKDRQKKVYRTSSWYYNLILKKEKQQLLVFFFMRCTVVLPAVWSMRSMKACRWEVCIRRVFCIERMRYRVEIVEKFRQSHRMREVAGRCFYYVWNTYVRFLIINCVP